MLLPKKCAIIPFMREAFSIPEDYSKKQARKEIEECLSEYVRSPRIRDY